MKKHILIGLSTLLTFTAVQPVLAQGSDPLFAESTCRSEGCLGDFVRVLALTAGEGIIGYGGLNEAMGEGYTGKLIKEIEASKIAVLNAQKAVFDAEATIGETERRARINAIRTDLAKLKQAADIGDAVKVSVNRSSAVNSDVFVSNEIKQLQSLNASLTESARISPAHLRVSLSKQISLNSETITRLQNRSIVSLSSSYHASQAVEVVDIYSKDLVPAIAEMERRLAHAEALPIVNEAQKVAAIAKAQAQYLFTKQQVAGMVKRNVGINALRVVAGATGVLVLADTAGRVLMYIGGKDPFMSPVVKLGGAAINAFKK